MSADKPLRVRVAEALGCKPKWGRGWSHREDSMQWLCGCEFAEHGWSSQADGIDLVMRYDTDWQATGPLIDRYLGDELTLRDAENHRPECRYHAYRYVHGVDEFEGFGPTVLVAVCNLLLTLHAAGKLR